MSLNIDFIIFNLVCAHWMFRREQEAVYHQVWPIHSFNKSKLHVFAQFFPDHFIDKKRYDFIFFVFVWPLRPHFVTDYEEVNVPGEAKPS
jgi:hypothetical protein